MKNTLRSLIMGTCIDIGTSHLRKANYGSALSTFDWYQYKGMFWLDARLKVELIHMAGRRLAGAGLLETDKRMTNTDLQHLGSYLNSGVGLAYSHNNNIWQYCKYMMADTTDPDGWILANRESRDIIKYTAESHFQFVEDMRHQAIYESRRALDSPHIPIEFRHNLEQDLVKLEKPLTRHYLTYMT